MNSKIYLDNAATTPLHPIAIEAITEALRENYGNPSSQHAIGRKAKVALESARSTIAKHLNCSSSEIVFTSGGTEADNLALRSSVLQLGVKRIISSKIEHHAVLHTIQELEQKHNIQLQFVQLKENGDIDIENLEFLLQSASEKTMVSLMHANNEIGNMIDIEKVGNLCLKYNALFHSDTVQTIGNFQFDLQKINVDFIVGAAHKFYGPKGTGFLYVNKRNKIHGMITGGGQEKNLRAGTENLASIVGMAAALNWCYTNFEEKKKHISLLKNQLKKSIVDHFEGVKICGNSMDHYSNYTVLNIAFPETEMADMMLFNLDLQGLCVSGGSACNSGALKGSHVIEALYPNSKKTNIRFSLGWFNTTAEIEKTIDILKLFFPLLNPKVNQHEMA